MPVNNNYEIQEYQGNSSGRIYNFPFRCFSLDHLKIELIDSKGSVTELIRNKDYKVTGGLDNSGGMITYPLDASLKALSSSETIRIYRSTPMEQSIDYPTYQQAIENALDKVTMLLQEAVNDSAVNIANEAREKVNQILAFATIKADTDGSNIDKYPFLTALGIGSDGELDLTDLCRTDGSNADAEAFQTLVRMPEVESDLSELSVSTAKTDGSNIQVDQWQTQLGIDRSMLAIAPQTIVKGAVGDIPEGWLEGWCDKPAEHLFYGNSLVAGYRGLLPYFTQASMPGWGVVVASSENLATQAGYLAFDNDRSTYWNTLSASSHTLKYTGKLKNGMLEAYSITARALDGNDATVAPSSWKLQDSDGNTLDTQSSITDWVSGETKVFILSTPVATSELGGLQFIDVVNNGYSGVYMAIGNISFLESIPEDSVIDIKAGLQVAAGVEGRVLLSNELEADVSVGTSGLTDGTHYVYADLNEDGTYAGFGSTDVEPKVGVSKFYLTVSQIPEMTSNNTPVGYVATASSSEVDAYKAFTSDLSSYWMSALTTGDHTLEIELPEAITLRKYIITTRYYGSTTGARAPKDWVLEGSNDDGVTWNTIDTQTDQFVGDIPEDSSTYSVNVDESYKVYQLRITAGRSSGVSIGYLELYYDRTDFDFYNTATHTHYNSDGNSIRRVYIGEVDIVSGAITHIVNYQHGTTVTMPVNGGENIGINSKYYLDTPYLGYGTSQARIYKDSKWGKTGWIFSDGGGFGVSANYSNRLLSVQTGARYLHSSYPTSSGGEISAPASTSAIAKVTVQRGW